MRRKIFVNKYQYTQDIAREQLGSYWNFKIRKFYTEMLVFIIIMSLFYLITAKLIFLLLCLLSFLPISLLFLKKERAIKLELERMEILYKGKPIDIVIETNKNIVMSNEQVKREFEYEDIESFFETDNLIVLSLKGNITISFVKNGFTKGSYEEFLILLNQKMLTKEDCKNESKRS